MVLGEKAVGVTTRFRSIYAYGDEGDLMLGNEGKAGAGRTPDIWGHQIYIRDLTILQVTRSLHHISKSNGNGR